MEFMFEWEADGDRFSFEDSDRFEDDSLCSWISEPESLCNNWRGWRKPNCSSSGSAPGTGSAHTTTPSTHQSTNSRDNRPNGTCKSLSFEFGSVYLLGIRTVISDLPVREGLLLQYSSRIHTLNPNPNYYSNPDPNPNSIPNLNPNPNPKLTLTLPVVHTWSSRSHVRNANLDGHTLLVYSLQIFRVYGMSRVPQ